MKISKIDFRFIAFYSMYSCFAEAFNRFDSFHALLAIMSNQILPCMNFCSFRKVHTMYSNKQILRNWPYRCALYRYFVSKSRLT